MAIYDQSSAGKTNDKSNKTPVQKEESTPSKKRSGDLVPEENKVVQLKTEGTDDPTEAELAEQKKKEREAAVTARWSSMLTKWLGPPLAKLVLEHVSVEALDGYVKEGLKAVGPGVGKVLKDQTKPPDAKAEEGLKEFSNALTTVITGQIDTWVSSPGGQKVLAAISTWVQDHPLKVIGIVAAAVLGGAYAAWSANPDVEFTVPLGLGKWDTKLGLDLGKLQNMGLQAASIVVANKNADIKMKAAVKKDEEKSDAGEVTKTTKTGTVDFEHGKKDAQHMTFALNGKIVETKDGLVAYSSGGKLEMVDPESGAKVTFSKDGGWDNKGNKNESFGYTASAGKDVTGTFKCNVSNATVVDTDGNIHSMGSREIGVAVGNKAAKFEVGQKTEEKDGKTTNTTSVGASMEGQLGAGTMFKGDSNVAIGEDKVVVKLNGKLTTEIAGKPVELEGSYQTDGPVKGRIKLGSGGEYKEITGEKKGDVITFSTKEVFAGGSLEQKTTSNTKDGTNGQQTTATANLGKDQKVTMSGGSEGNEVAYEGKNIGGSNVGVNGSAGTNAAGETSVSGGVKYDDGVLKAQLDATMTQGKGSLNLGASMNHPDGYKFDSTLKLDNKRITELGLKLGYQNPDEFKGFLVGYKQTWVEQNQQYQHHFDGLLEYSVGKWYTRATAGLDLMGNKIQKTSIDATVGYQLNPSWMLIGGVQANGAQNQGTNAFDMSYKPYIGGQYKSVGVAFTYDTQKKVPGLMLTLPLRRP